MVTVNTFFWQQYPKMKYTYTKKFIGKIWFQLENRITRVWHDIMLRGPTGVDQLSVKRVSTY